MTTLLSRASRLTLDLLFPARCALCSRGGDMLCDGCAASLPAADGARCDRCWAPVRDGVRLCRHCFDAPPAFDSLRSAFVMTAGARELAHALKYDGMTALAEAMAALILAQVASLEGDIVVPVPLHRSRERRRGYNQATEVAKHLARVSGIAFEPRAARRLRNTAPLVKAMSREERRDIVRGAFTASAELVEGRRVVLIDDVTTTGATLDACARALRDAGAREVRCITWARED